MPGEHSVQDLSRQVAVEVLGLDLGGGMDRGAHVPPFGSDIRAAWEIVEQMGRRYPGMKLKLLQDQLGWQAVFSDHGIGVAPLEVSARTPAEAICEAALATVKRMRRSSRTDSGSAT